MSDEERVHAITVIGHDRPGIIAETTGALAKLGLNLEDSTMTLLRGHFAMTLVCAGSASSRQIEERLGFLTGDGALDVTVREISEESDPPAVASTYVLTVHGADRPGIVSSMASQVAAVGGNITDLATRLASGLYILGAEVDLPAGTDIARLEAAISETAERLGVGATLRPLDSDDL